VTEITIALQSKQKLCREKLETVPVVLYGGAKGGGKSGGMRRIFLIDCFKIPNLRAAIFRKTYPELLGNHIRKLLEEYPQLSKYYNDSKKIINFPNGSTLEFCYARNEKDLDNYQGREFHRLGIDEIGQWTESMFTKLWGSCRSSVPGIVPRTLLSANPGGVGHSWLKRIFITRKFIGEERPQDYIFIQALVDDNAALIDNDPDYIHRLNAEKNEALRRAYRYGDWDIIAGAFFGEIRKDVHFIKPFNIPKHWKRFGAYDYGYGHPAAFGWFCCDEDGNVYMYREYAQAKQRIDQSAAAFNKHEDTQQLEYIVAGHDCWVEKGNGLTLKNVAPTIAEAFSAHKINLSKANIGRIQGASHLRNYLAWQDLPEGRENPRFFIFNTCPLTFDCLTRMEHDPDRIEDVLKVDADNGDPTTGDDLYDMVRYALMSRPPISDTPKHRHKHGSENWAKEEAARIEEELLKQMERNKNQESGLEFNDDPWSKNGSSFDNDLT
jgi:phage terminase large subunit